MSVLGIALLATGLGLLAALLVRWWQMRRRQTAAAGAAFFRRIILARLEARRLEAGQEAAAKQCLWDGGCDEDRAGGDPYCPGHIALVCGRTVVAA